ncbi:MAG TPA: F0F1 ATP synthase subunit A [Myxococcales bacterium]|jgi:F-type H+-transporting ATPase subunit a
MGGSPFEADLSLRLGPLPVTRPVVMTWGLMAAIAAVCWLGTRRLRVRPGRLQSALEILVGALASQVRDVLRQDPQPFLPLLGTLFIFLAVANLSAIVPGLEPPTAHLETPAALALIVFLSVHFYGVRSQGLGKYLGHYLKPNPVMLPLHVLSEITRTFSLMVRLFGNVMSHEFIIGIVISLAGFLVPVPLMALSVLIGIVQAYIFTILATVYVGAAVGNADHEGRQTP